VQAPAEDLAVVAAAEAVEAAAVAPAEHVNGILTFKRELAIKVFSSSNDKYFQSCFPTRRYDGINRMKKRLDTPDLNSR
jgi:hypothetical protein